MTQRNPTAHIPNDQADKLRSLAIRLQFAQSEYGDIKFLRELADELEQENYERSVQSH